MPLICQIGRQFCIMRGSSVIGNAIPMASIGQWRNGDRIEKHHRLFIGMISQVFCVLNGCLLMLVNLTWQRQQHLAVAFRCALPLRPLPHVAKQ